MKKMNYKEENTLFVLKNNIKKTTCNTRKNIQIKIEPVFRISNESREKIKKLQGTFGFLYLKNYYGSNYTFILTAWADKELVHMEWIVPYEKIKKRYPFVCLGSSSIISCFTREDYRGCGIFPYALYEVSRSKISEMYYVWAHQENHSSLKSIRKAGAFEIGSFVRKLFFYGFFSKIETYTCSQLTIN